MFELVDIWTETTEEQEYLDLLNLLVNGITKVSTSSSILRTPERISVLFQVENANRGRRDVLVPVQ